MPTLVVQAPDSEPVSVPLDPGTYSVGSAEGNRVVLGHPSVAAHHCDLTVYPDGAMVVRDAGSSGGTWIGEERIGVGSFGAGQTLRLGEVRCTLGSLGADESEDVPEPVSLPPATRSTEVWPEVSREASNTGFWASWPAALGYPLRGDGWIPVLFLAAVQCVTTYWLGFRMLGGLLVGLLLGAAILRLGRQIVLTTLHDPEAPFPTPDYSGEAEELQAEAWTWLTLVLVSFGPVILAAWVPGIPAGMLLATLVFGVLYFPMALLGVVIADHLGPLSPVFVGRSVLRGGGPYLAVAAALALGIGMAWVAGEWVNDPSSPPVWRAGASGVISLVGFYFAFVWLRLLGLFCRHYRHRLGWEF